MWFLSRSTIFRMFRTSNSCFKENLFHSRIIGRRFSTCCFFSFTSFRFARVGDWVRLKSNVTCFIVHFDIAAILHHVLEDRQVNLRFPNLALDDGICETEKFMLRRIFSELKSHSRPYYESNMKSTSTKCLQQLRQQFHSSSINVHKFHSSKQKSGKAKEEIIKVCGENVWGKLY